MIEDVYEPLSRYRDEFRERFASLAAAKFEELTYRSRIDIRSNRALAADIAETEKRAASARTRKTCFGCLSALAFAGAAAAAAFLFLIEHQPDERTFAALAAGAAACVLAGIAALVQRFKAAKRLRELNGEIAAMKERAWKQMEGLNRLYTWDLIPKLIEATVPRLGFDPYFTADRLVSLKENYGWKDSFNDGKSIIFAQSGEINANPFVFATYLDMHWGTKTYEGTKRISWTEYERGPDGKRRSVTRHQTLRATVVKPYPEYREHNLLVYANDAAPGLSFTHEPSGLTGKESSIRGKMKKYLRMRDLDKFSRNLDDDSNFTMMANKEFETWFHTKDRTDEVEFRLLFTPVAQMQMLALMKDTEIGYGDDFRFEKRKKINTLTSRHLDAATIDTDPEKFRHWSYDKAKAFFMEHTTQYFKDVYFSLAPILCIPLYQQTRTHEEIWKGVVDGAPSSFWEHESLANYIGDGHFKSENCATRSILKTRLVERKDGESAVAVTAYGYRAEKRVETKSVHGGDGHWHDVAVEWNEYLPVKRTRTMCLTERAEPSELFKKRADAAPNALRRSIFSYLPTP